MGESCKPILKLQQEFNITTFLDKYMKKIASRTLVGRGTIFMQELARIQV